MYCTRSLSLRRDRRPPPVRSAADALEVVALAMSRPPRPETIGFALDDDGRGDMVMIVDGTTRPEAVVDMVELLADAAVAGHGSGLVVASVRPVPPSGTDLAGIADADIDRWLDASDVAADRGIELLEWFVVGPGGITCPREMFGEPPRWPWSPG